METIQQDSKEKILNIFKAIGALTDEEKVAFIHLFKLKIEQEMNDRKKEDVSTN